MKLKKRTKVEAADDDVEVWHPVLGYESRYEVSSHGRVRSLLNGRILIMRQRPMKGYRRISLRKDNKDKLYLVHRLVWMAFNGPIPTDLEVNHKDGIKSNNLLTNLEIITHTDNYWHAVKQGRVVNRRGTECTQSVLTEDDVREIRRIVKETRTSNKRGQPKGFTRQIASQFGCDPSLINLVVSGKVWKHVL